MGTQGYRLALLDTCIDSQKILKIVDQLSDIPRQCAVPILQDESYKALDISAFDLLVTCFVDDHNADQTVSILEMLWQFRWYRVPILIFGLKRCTDDALLRTIGQLESLGYFVHLHRSKIEYVYSSIR
jgi:hypothetical protein